MARAMKTEPTILAQPPMALVQPMVATSVTSGETERVKKMKMAIKTRLIPIPSSTALGISFLFQESPSTAWGTAKGAEKQNMDIPKSARVTLPRGARIVSGLKGTAKDPTASSNRITARPATAYFSLMPSTFRPKATTPAAIR